MASQACIPPPLHLAQALAAPMSLEQLPPRRLVVFHLSLRDLAMDVAQTIARHLPTPTKPSSRHATLRTNLDVGRATTIVNHPPLSRVGEGQRLPTATTRDLRVVMAMAIWQSSLHPPVTMATGLTVDAVMAGQILVPWVFTTATHVSAVKV